MNSIVQNIFLLMVAAFGIIGQGEQAKAQGPSKGTPEMVRQHEPIARQLAPQPSTTLVMQEQVSGSGQSYSACNNIVLLPGCTVSAVNNGSVQFVIKPDLCLEVETAKSAASSTVVTADLVIAFPNPTSDRFTLRWSQAGVAKVEAEAYNLQGQRMMVTAPIQELEGGEHQIEVDAHDWPVGVYLWRLKIGDRLFTGKLTKQ